MTVKEEVPIGTVVGVLEAIDEDIGDNAAIDYAITGKKVQHNLRISISKLTELYRRNN